MVNADNSLEVTLALCTGGIRVVVEMLSILLWSLFGASTPLVASTQAADLKPIAIFVDVAAKGLIYRVDGEPVALFEVRKTLEDKVDRSKPPDQRQQVVIVVHENVAFSRADELRLLTRAAGYDDPRVFYFGKDRRLMVEVTYADAIAFSPKGPGSEKR